ncbi:hypothetical protein PHJA_002607300 [Phtheirospermum japonicum]|uniref:Uncharacterized protein n=1 Tax=Phtheirospermum japonicum TaxID=374723 RepID=A0A830D1W1_9LAMI|nr:hypothetical protein PHJA_002607300 [Phtheirospermum japonicum]
MITPSDFPLKFYTAVSSSIRDRSRDIMTVVAALAAMLLGAGCGLSPPLPCTSCTSSSLAAAAAPALTSTIMTRLTMMPTMTSPVLRSFLTCQSLRCPGRSRMTSRSQRHRLRR